MVARLVKVDRKALTRYHQEVVGSWAVFSPRCMARQRFPLGT